MTTAAARLIAAHDTYVIAAEAHAAAHPVDLFRPLAAQIAIDAAAPKLTAEAQAGEMIRERGINGALACAAQTLACVYGESSRAWWGDVVSALVAAQAVDGEV